MGGGFHGGRGLGGKESEPGIEELVNIFIKIFPHLLDMHQLIIMFINNTLIIIDIQEHKKNNKVLPCYFENLNLWQNRDVRSMKARLTI